MSHKHKNENEMKLRFDRPGLSVGCQKFKVIRASQCKLRSIDSCQNGTLEDHYQITNNEGSKTRSARLKCLTNTRSQRSFYSKIRHFNELQSIDSCQTTPSPDHHHLTVSRTQVSAYRVRVFLKLSAGKLLLSDD